MPSRPDALKVFRQLQKEVCLTAAGATTWKQAVTEARRKRPARNPRVIHLDTNFLIDALVPGSGPEAQLMGWLGAGETLGISAVA